jgi:hypothetical protein
MNIQQSLSTLMLSYNLRNIIILTFLLAATHVEVVAQQLIEKEIPAGVKKVANEHSDNQRVVSWVKDSKRQKYIATIINNTMMRNIEISLDGKLIRTSDVVQESRLPASVRKTLQENYLNKGFKGKNYLLIKDTEKGTYYSADVSSEHESFHISIDSSGKLIKTEVR